MSTKAERLIQRQIRVYIICWGFTVVKNPLANVGDTKEASSIPGLGRSPGVGNGNPLQYPCLENSMERGAWWVTVHEVAKSWERLACTHIVC